MSKSLIARSTWATAMLAAVAVATGCSSHSGNAGGTATAVVSTASSATTATSVAPAASTASSPAGQHSTTGATSTMASGTAQAPSATASASRFTPLPVPTTAVSAPGGGSVQETVAAQTPSMLPTAPLTHPATVGQSSVAIKVSRINVKATMPGDVSGPALQVVTTITNKGTKPLSTTSLVVNVQDAAQTPATPMTSGPFKRIAETIAPGRTASGTYVFHLGTAVKQPITATVYVAQGLPTAVFTGKV